MKKSIILLSVFTLLGMLSYGQSKTKKAVVDWGPELKRSKKELFVDVVGADQNTIYTTVKTVKRFSQGKYSLIAFDDKFRLSRANMINLKENGVDKTYEDIIQFNDELYLLSSFRNQKLKKNYLFAQTVDKKSLLPNRDSKKIAEIGYEKRSKYNSGSFDYEFSYDKSKLLIYYNLPYDKGASEKFGIHVFDNEFNQLWEKGIILPYKEELFSIEGYIVDNQGNVHVLGVEYKDKARKKRMGSPNYSYHVLSYYKDSKQHKDYEVKLVDKYITDMQIAINDEKEIICGGFYSNTGTSSIAGTFYLKINAETKKIEVQNFKEFDIDFITENLSEKKEAKTKKKAEKGKDVELYRYVLDDIILREDGGAVLVGEQYYVTVSTTTTTNSNGSTSTTTTYHYYYNDIIVTNISPKGEIDWASKIAKYQHSTNDGGFYSSYALSIVEDKLYFIFNDNAKNLKYDGKGAPYNFTRGRESIVMLVEVDSDGEQSREALTSLSDSGMLTRPKVCRQISDNEMIIYGMRGKKYKLGKVTFK